MTEVKNLYYYCSLKTAIEHILPKKEILINPIGKSNDPRENKSYNFVYSMKNHDPDFNPWRMNDEISSLLRNGCKQTCFSSDNNNVKGYEFSRLWALYADNHKGICLEIDKEVFLKENSTLLKKNGYFKKIEYDDLNKGAPLSLNFDVKEYRNNKLNYINEFKLNNIDNLYFRKNDEWKSEKEMRLLFISSKPENEYCTIEKSLKKIILGIDFNSHYLPAILKNCEHIQVKNIIYWNGRLNLNNVKND